MKKKENKQNLRKDFFWNTLGSGINSFNSLFFLIIVTRINGISDAGIFTLAFSTANLFYIIGVYSGRVFQVTDSSKITDNDYFLNKIITCILMLVVSVGFVLARGYDLWKSSIVLVLCLFKTFEAFVEVIYAFFQKKNYLYRVGVSLTLKNILGLIVFLLTDIFVKNVFVSSLMLLFIYVLVMIFYDFRYLDCKNISLKNVIPKNVALIFKKGFFTFCLSFLTMYILNIPRYVVDANMNNSYSTIFGILIMPASVVVLVAHFVLHPFLLKLKEAMIINVNKFIVMLLKILGFVFGFGVLALIISYFIGIPFLELVYNIDLVGYKKSLMFVMCGATLNGIILILSNILISMRITFKQLIIYCVSSVFSLILSNSLILKIGVNGACISYALTILVTFMCYVILMFFSVINLKKGRVKVG